MYILIKMPTYANLFNLLLEKYVGFVDFKTQDVL